MKRLYLILAAVFLSLLVLFVVHSVADAQVFRAGNNTTVESGTTIDGTYFTAGNSVTIAGAINGDVFCAGQNVEISGTVNGDIFCAAQNLTLKGQTNGNARLAGQNITVSGNIERNVSLAASAISIDENVEIGQDLQLTGSNITINGEIGRDLVAAASVININGSIGRNARINDGQLNINEGAAIGGDLTYRAKEDAKIANNTVKGQTNKIEPRSVNQDNRRWSGMAFVLSYAYWLISFLILSILLVLLFPNSFKNAYLYADKRPLATSAFGLILVWATPFVMILIALTVIGIPIAIIIGLIYMLLLILSGPFFAYFIGCKIMRERKTWLQMLIGSLVILVALAIPIINLIAFMVSVIFGSGMIANYFYTKRTLSIEKP